jgi:alpha-1,2-mannosyltransferase/arabinofuranan 3-O-arabinosyltransferase
MAQLEATSGSRRTWSFRPAALTDLLSGARVWLFALALFFLYQGAQLFGDYRGIVEMMTDGEPPLLDRSDFPAFYGGARLFLDDPANAYADLPQTQAIYAAKGLAEADAGAQWYHYYNPPFYSLLLAPLMLLDVRMAYAVTLAVNGLGLALLLRVLFHICGGRNATSLLLVAGILTSVPVNYAFWHAQPTLFLAALTGLAYLEQERGRERLAGLYWALCAIKPHWMLFNGFVLLRRSSGVLRPFLVASAALALPFLLIGSRGIVDYVRLLTGRAEGDVADVNFTEAVLSWSGFFRGLASEPMPLAWLFMSALTLALFVHLLRRGDFSLLPLAAGLTTLLVIPHSHPQDWILLAPGAAFLLRRQDSGRVKAVAVVLLLVIYSGLADWAGMDTRHEVVYWPAPAAFLLLGWLCVLSRRDREATDAWTEAGRSRVSLRPG